MDLRLVFAEKVKPKRCKYIVEGLGAPYILRLGDRVAL